MNQIVRLSMSCLGIMAAVSSSSLMIAAHAQRTTANTSAAARWGEAYNRGDIPAVVALYTNDAELLPRGTQAISGHAAIRGYFDQMRAAHPSYKIYFSHVEMYPGDKFASEIADIEIRDGSIEPVATGRQILVLEQENGTWKIHRDMWTNNPEVEHRP